MESEVSNLCCGCLAGDRKMHLIQNNLKEQCYLQIIKEITITLPNELSLWLCWECEANITRFTKFKLQVKHSYQILHEFTKQHEFTPIHRKFSINRVVDITLSPNVQNNTEFAAVATIKTPKGEDSIAKLVKYETDYSEEDDKLLIDICKDNFKKKKSKMRRKIKKQGIFREVELSEQVEVETKDLSLTHDYVKIKTEKNEDNLTALIKYETDYSEDDKLIDTCKDNFKKKKSKMKRNVKKQGMFREVELSEEQVEAERKDLALRDDYVNAMFRCQLCVVSFPNEEDMKDHVWKKHELHASKHKCGICQCAFNTEVAYNYHRGRHVKRYQCSVCKVICASKVAANNHYSTHLQSASYDLGYKTYKNTEQNADHNGTKSEEKFPCEYCPKVFGWKTSLRKHLETHKIEAGQKRRPYCEPCRLSFTTTSNLQKHVKTSSKHQIQLKLRKLRESNPRPETMNEAQIADIKTLVNRQRELYPCEQCDKKFQWRGNLLRHLHSHAARANGELVCAPCNRTFSSIATYKQHMKISKKHASENDFKYMCSDCGKRFANKTKLRDHVDWEHLKNYVHTCSDCQKVFRSHTSLYLHRQVVHRCVSADHLCENCGKSFPNQTKLRSHIVALHTRESPYKCGDCGARFSWHSCLSRHLRRVHRNK